MSKRRETQKEHVFVFGTLFLFVFIFISYSFSEAVLLKPENLIVHTNLVYYDGQFSQKLLVEDTYTALYVLNQSTENVYATVFEYDKNRKEISTAVQVGPQQNQFIKTDGPGVVYLTNTDGTATATVKFSKWKTIKKYTIPTGFKF